MIISIKKLATYLIERKKTEDKNIKMVGKKIIANQSTIQIGMLDII